MFSHRRFFLAAAWTAALFPGCVSVKQHGQVVDQLALEQRKAVARERERRELEFLSRRLRKRAELAELERDEARAKLASTERPVASRPAGAVPARSGAGAGRSGSPPAGGAALVGTVSFAAGSDGLSDDDRKRIAEIARRLAQRLARAPSAAILIEGHSDPSPIGRTQPRFRSNMHISTARALAVYHEFIRQPGVDARRVVVLGYGEHGPGEAGARPQRRVDIRYRPAP